MLPVHESWQAPLAPVEDQIHAMGDFLRAEREYGDELRCDHPA